MGQLRLIIPALGTIVSAVGVSSTQVNNYEQIALVSVGPISYIITGIWSLIANSRESIMTAAAKPAARGLPPPQIVLPPEEADLAQKLPSNVNTTMTKQVIDS
jgi:hypothetical protein